MPKLSLMLSAILLLYLAIASCKEVAVEPTPDDDTDTTEVTPKGWAKVKDYPGAALRWTLGFSAGNKGYVIGGQYEKTSDGNAAQVFQYDPAADEWQQLNNYPGDGMGMMAGFSINSKVYLGTGYNYSSNVLCADFWEYNPANDTWLQKADFPGGKRQAAISFSINNNGYLMGSLLRARQDLWKYTPANDEWTQMADYPGTGIAEMISATVNGKAYVGAGTSMEEVVNDFWEYNPATNEWTKKVDVIESLYNPVTFTKGTLIFVIGGIGQDMQFRKAVLVYDTATDKWTKTEDFEGQERAQAVGFVIGNTAYFGLGAGSKTAGGAKYPVYFNDFWKFTP